MDRLRYLCGRAIVWAALAMALPLAATRAQTFLPVPVNLSNTGHAVSPSIAVGPSGDIDVVWLDSGSILFRRSVDGGQTFSATMTVATADLPPASSSAPQPQIAANSAGVYVAWGGGNATGGGDIFFSSLGSGASSWLSPPVNVSNSLGIASGMSAPEPHMAVDPSGGVDIVWGQNGAYFQRTANGTSFSGAVQLTSSAMASVSPRMAINSQGHVFVVWENAATCPTITFARSTDAGASFTDYSVADNLTVNGQPVTGCTSDVQIAVGASNSIWLVWANENTQIQDLIITYATDVDPFTQPPSTSFPEAEFENLSGTASETPQMAIDTSGDIDVVWIGNYQQNGGPEAVYFSRSTDPEQPGSFCGGQNDPTCTTPPILTSPPRTGLATGFPQIVAEPSGAMDIIWQQASAANPSAAYDIVLARSTDGLNFKQFTLDNAPTLAANTGQIAADASGNVYAVWLGSSGSGGDVFLNGDSSALTTPPPFSLSGVTASVSPSSAVINVGGSANFSISLSSTNPVSGTVGLTCSGVPVGLSCSFSPNSVNLGANGSASATLTIVVSATPSTSATQRNPGGRAGPPGAMPDALAERVWGLGVVVFLVMLIAARHEDARLARCARTVAWSLILAAVVTAMVSCGGSASSGGGGTGGSGGGGSGGSGSSVTVPVVVQAQANSATANLQTISITVP